MHQLPLIRDTQGDFSGGRNCAGQCPRGGQTKELHNIHRTLPVPGSSSNTQDMLQDEDGFGFLDDQTGQFIFDDLRQ